MNIKLGVRGHSTLAMLTIAATVAALTLWHAGPASAVAAPRLVEVESASDIASVKTAKAECNADEDVYGSGYYVRGGNGRVTVNDLSIQHQLWFVEVQAQVTDEGLTSAWSVVAQAICGPHVEGLHRELNFTPHSSLRSQSVNVECASGQAYGGGFFLEGTAGNVFLNGMVFDSAHRGLTVSASVDASAATPPSGWGIAALVVCGPPAPVMTVRRTSSFEPSSSAQRDGDAQCLSPTRVHGAGVIVGASASDLGNIVIDQARIDTPALPLTTHVQAFENNATPRSWFVRAQAICAT